MGSRAVIEAQESELWEQQEGESDRAFEASKAYRDMGGRRSLRALPASIAL